MNCIRRDRDETSGLKLSKSFLSNILCLLWHRLDLLFQEDPRIGKVYKQISNKPNHKKTREFHEDFQLTGAPSVPGKPGIPGFPCSPCKKYTQQDLVHSSEFSSLLRVNSFLRVYLQRLVHSPELTFISQMHQPVLYRMYNSLAFSSSLCIRHNTATRVQSNTKNIVFFLEISSNSLVTLPCLLQVRWLLEDLVDPSGVKE